MLQSCAVNPFENQDQTTFLMSKKLVSSLLDHSVLPSKSHDLSNPKFLNM